MIGILRAWESVRLSCVAALVVTTAIPATLGNALALDRVVVVINGTQVPLVRFYASNVGENAWGTDHLGQDVLNPDESIEINLDDGSGYCMFDFRGEFSDGDVVEDYRVNACAITRFCFYDDPGGCS